MKTQFLSKWKHRDVDALLDGVARYTQFVLVSKYSLVLLAVLLVLLVIVMPLINPDVGGVRIVFSSTPDGKGGDIAPKMVNPKYHGVDKNNQPFSIEAESAIQQDGHTVLLSRLKADITQQKSSWLVLNADSGIWNTDTKNLRLTGHVQLFSADGYEFTTEAVDVDMAGGIAIGNLPVQGQGPLGTITAQGFIISERGNNILFNRSVALRLYPGTKNK